MEQLKALEELTKIDEKNLLLAKITGGQIDLSRLYEAVKSVELHDGVPEEIRNQYPEEIRNQYNVTRNMALYTYFFYSLAPVVQLKTYILIEHALKIKNGKGKSPFKQLLCRAVEKGWISDKGFRHLSQPSDTNEYSKTLIDVLPHLRNDAAHGSNMLTPDCVGHLEKCVDFINQLYVETGDVV